jgi:hypothetical protein
MDSTTLPKTFPSNTGIRIRPFGHSWQLIVPRRFDGMNRIRLQFRTLTEAESAGDQALQNRHSKDFFCDITARERFEFCAAVSVIRDLGVSVRSVMDAGIASLATQKTPTFRAVVDELSLGKEVRSYNGDLRPASWNGFQQHARRMTAFLGDTKIGTITNEDIKRFIETLGTGAHLRQNFLYRLAGFSNTPLHGATSPSAH